MTKSIVIFSGGQDSTTCLAVARDESDYVYALSFDYHQRHRQELFAATRIARYLNVDHEILKLPSNTLIGDSPLINKDNVVGEYKSVESLPTGVEPTFVHGRNILFLTIAANRAASIGADTIYIGVCEADFAGYWDCRQDFISSMELALNKGIYGNQNKLKIKAPLMYLSKAEGIQLAIKTLKNDWHNVFAMTHTCYNNVKGGCGKCHSCLIRQSGFDSLNLQDPLKCHG